MLDAFRAVHPFALALLVSCGVALFSHAALSQTTPAVEAGGSDRVAVPLQSVTLDAGSLSAVVELPATNVPLAAGSSTFANVTIKTNSKTPRSGELKFSATNGAIKTIFQAEGTISERGAEAVVPLKAIRSNRERKVLVEIALAPGAAASDLGLSVALTSMDGEKASSVPAKFSWSVKDCAGAFRRALSEAADTRLAGIDESLNALRPARRSAETWIFRPDLRSLRRNACRGKKCAEEAASTPGAVTSDERSLIIEAQSILSTGGADPNLTRESAMGWPTFKAASDLKGYLKQPANPAICTGALQFSDYYLKNLGRLKARVERVKALAGMSSGLIQARIEFLRSQASALPGGHPAWGGATLALARPASTGNVGLSESVVELAKLSGLAPDAIMEIEKAEGLRSALEASARHWDAAAITDKSYRSQAEFVLSLVEAADVIARLAANYDRLEKDFLGTFAFIRDAYKEHCICNSN